MNWEVSPDRIGSIGRRNNRQLQPAVKERASGRHSQFQQSFGETFLQLGKRISVKQALFQGPLFPQDV